MSLIAALLLSAASLQDDTARKIDDLIRQLGSDEFSVREKASEELKKIGKPAEEALRKAAETTDDPEVRERARGVLESMAPKPKAAAPAPRGGPGFNFGFNGGRGSSVTVQTVNGDSTYRITPGDGSPALTFLKTATGAVTLEYPDEKGETKKAEAESVEKFLKDHKELAEKFGITEDGIAYGGARVGFKGGAFQALPLPLPRGFARPRMVVPAPEPERAAGAVLEKPDDSLRAQLDLPEGQGLVVARVDDGSAAEAAGLRKNDVLLEVDGKKITTLRDAKDALQKSSSCVVLRKGKRETVGGGAPKKDF